jgi:hypothetical protein
MAFFAPFRYWRRRGELDAVQRFLHVRTQLVRRIVLPLNVLAGRGPKVAGPPCWPRRPHEQCHPALIIVLTLRALVVEDGASRNYQRLRNRGGRGRRLLPKSDAASSGRPISPDGVGAAHAIFDYDRMRHDLRASLLALRRSGRGTELSSGPIRCSASVSPSASRAFGARLGRYLAERARRDDHRRQAQVRPTTASDAEQRVAWEERRSPFERLTSR